MSLTAALSEMGSLEIPADGSSLAAALRGHDRFEARICLSAGEFESLGMWEPSGFTSANAWLADQGMHPHTANELLRLARKLRRLPATAAAWVEGRLTGGQIRIICGLVIDRHVKLFGEQEHELIPVLSELGVEDTLRAMRFWRDRADALNPAPSPADEPCTAYLSQTMDDRGVLNATLDAEGYALWFEALRLAEYEDLSQPAPLRRGESLKTIARFFIDNQDMKSPRRHVPHLKIIIDGATLGTDHVHGYDEATGVTLRPETIERLLCDCVMHRVVLAEGVVLDYGRAIKEPPPDLVQAIAVRDQGCRWSNCGRPVGWCNVHHVKEWIKHFGPTAAWNLVMLCPKHHHVLHRDGWKAKLHANGDFEVTSPWGQTWVTHPPGAIQQRIRPLGDPHEDVGSPLEDHLEDFERAYMAQRRFMELRDKGIAGRAIASLARLTGRAAA